MRVVAERGNLLGARLSDVVAEITDFESFDERLKIRGEAHGPTGEFLRFIDQSPVSEKIDNFTRGMKATGNGKLDLTLDIPLRRVTESRVSGEFQLQNNQVHLSEGLAPLTQVNGRLQLTENSVVAQDIVGRVFGGPLKVQVKSAGDKVGVVAVSYTHLTLPTIHTV